MSESATLWTVAHQAPLSWDFLGKNTREDYHFLLQGIFPTQGSNPHLLYLMLYTVREKQDLELTVAQNITFLLWNWGLDLKKYGKQLDIQVWPKSSPLWLYSKGDK